MSPVCNNQFKVIGQGFAPCIQLIYCAFLLRLLFAIQLFALLPDRGYCANLSHAFYYGTRSAIPFPSPITAAFFRLPVLIPIIRHEVVSVPGSAPIRLGYCLRTDMEQSVSLHFANVRFSRKDNVYFASSWLIVGIEPARGFESLSFH